MTEHWTTIGVTALPPGWINVFEGGDGFFTAPCPAVLLQERQEDGERETRVIAAGFASDSGELEDVDGDLTAHCYTLSVEQWESERDELERGLHADRDRIKRSMLDMLATAGDSGVSAFALVDAHRLHHLHHRAVEVRRGLERDGLVTTKWEANPSAFQGRECIFRLADPAPAHALA